MNCFCRQGLKRVYGRVSLDTSSKSTVVPDSILKIDLNPTSVQPSLFYNASLGLRMPASNLLPSLFLTFPFLQNPCGNQTLKLKQNEEQTKMKLCWKVYANKISIAYWLFLGYVTCPVPSSFPGLAPSIVPRKISLLQVSVLSIHYLKCTCHHTYIHLGFIFLLFVYVIPPWCVVQKNNSIIQSK